MYSLLSILSARGHPLAAVIPLFCGKTGNGAGEDVHQAGDFPFLGHDRQRTAFLPPFLADRKKAHAPHSWVKVGWTPVAPATGKTKQCHIPVQKAD